MKEAVALAKELMAIPGRSGDEERVIAFIIDRLRSVGLPASAIRTDQVHRRSPFGGTTGNLIVKLPGTYRVARRLFLAHLDTVPICVGSRPILRGPWIRSANRTTGLGADNRSGVATILSVALRILREQLKHAPSTFLFPVQEEVGLIGTRYVSLTDLGRPKLGFNFDGGSATKLTIGATGSYRMLIEISGRASHAGLHPELGVSAISIASQAIAKLKTDRWLGKIRKASGSGTSNIGSIQADGATNVVPDRVVLRAEVRSHSVRFRRSILQAFQRTFERAAQSERNDAGECGTVRIRSNLDYEAFKLSAREPCVREAMAAVKEVGGEPSLFVCNGGIDANWLTQRGIPTVTLGSGQKNQHSVHEMLDIRTFTRACHTAFHLATAK